MPAPPRPRKPLTIPSPPPRSRRACLSEPARFTAARKFPWARRSESCAGHTFNAVDTTTTVRHYTLENVVLDANSLILFKDGRAIPETGIFRFA